MELPLLKSSNLLKFPIIAFLILFGLILLSVVPAHYPLPRNNWLSDSAAENSSELSPPLNIKAQEEEEEEKLMKFVEINEECDISNGEWIPNPEAPYYTNTSCWAIHEHQNCMKYGRPDSGFMKWRWKPDGCDLPVFNPYQFLEIVRGKSMAFVGDSVARNQMQSLVCLLSRVEYPIDASYTQDDYFRRWNYTSYNFTLAAFWSPFLIKVKDPTGLYKLYLDEFDQKWTNKIEGFDYVIISAGHWFDRPGIYYENRRLVGCRFCQMSNITDLPATYAYQRAFRMAFKAINKLKNYKGITFLRTFAPSHFENGDYNKGGNCVRKSPFKRNEIELEGKNLDFYRAQLEEFQSAERTGKKKGLKFRLLDTTKATLLRPDGHPSTYGHWPNANVTLYNDCVHWCLPGPIDTWNDFLLHMLKIENKRSS